MTIQKTFRMAIAGTGAIAGFHAQAIAGLPNAQLVAVCGRNLERAKAFAQTHQAQAYTDLDTMLDEARPDVLCVTTPSGAHLEPVLAAAARQVHVICEKPLEITSGRITQMIEACDQANITLGAIFQQRMSPLLQTLYQAAKAGRFGEKPTIQCSVPWWREDAYYGPDRWQGTLAMDGGGALMNQAIHGVDLVQWLAGAASQEADNPVEEVFTYTAKNGHDPSLIEVEDTAVLNLKFRSGGLGQILAATSMYPGSLRRLQIAGRDGMAEILEDQLLVWSFREETAEDETIRQTFGQTTQHGGGASDPLALDTLNHQRNIALILEAIEHNKPLSLTGLEATKAVNIILAAYESAKTNQAVAIEG